MNVDDKIQQVQWVIATHQAVEKFLVDNRDFLATWNGLVFESCGTLYFSKHDGKITHEETLSILKQFPGKWVKSYDDDKVSYELEKAEGEKLGLSVYEAEAPPSCRIEEVEEEVPAQPARKVIRRKLVCS